MLLRRNSRDHSNRPWQPLGLGLLVLSGAMFLLQFAAVTPVAQAADEIKTATTAGSTSAGEAKPIPMAKNTYGIPQVAYINEMIRKGWVDNKVTPSPYATDGEWCRRVYLDIIGRIPTVPELNAFLSDQNTLSKINQYLDCTADLINRFISKGS